MAICTLNVLCILCSLLCTSGAIGAEPLNLVANPLPTLVAEDNEPARINLLIERAFNAIGVPVTLHIDRPAFSGSGLLTGKYSGEYAFLSLNDKRDEYLYSDAYLPANLYLTSRKSSLADISHFSHINKARVAAQNRLVNTPVLRREKMVSWVRNPTVFDSFKQLSEQRAEYLLEDDLILREFNRLLTDNLERPLFRTTQPIVKASFHVSVRADQPGANTTLKAFNAFINQAQQNGTYNQIFGITWLSKDVDGDGIADWITSTNVPHTDITVNALDVAFALDTTKPSPLSKFFVDGDMINQWQAVQTALINVSHTARQSYLDSEIYKRMMNRW